MREGIDLLHEAGRTIGDPEREVLDDARQRLTAAAHSEASRLRKRAMIKRTVSSLIGTAAVIALVLGLVFTNSNSGNSPMSTDTSKFLTATAVQAEKQVRPEGAFWYSKTLVEKPPASGPAIERQAWVSPTNIGRVMINGKIMDDSARGPETFGETIALTWSELSALPTEPSRLDQELRRVQARQRSGSSSDAMTFAAIGELLSESPASPALRSALFRVASSIEGTRLLGLQKDGMGREGMVVERGDAYGEMTVKFWINPDNATLLQSEYVPTKPEYASRAVKALYVADGFVDALGSLPTN